VSGSTDRLFDREAAKRAQFDNLRKAAVDGLQTSKGVVQREHGYLVPARHLESLIDRHALNAR
jgi:hypothetical protein